MKDKLLTHLDPLVAFVKLCLSEGIVKTAKKDKRSTGIIGGVLAVLLILPMMFGGDDSESSASSRASSSASSGASIESYESDSMDLSKPYGVFHLKNVLGEKTYLDFSNKRLVSFEYINGKRIIFFDVEIPRIMQTTMLDLRKTGMKDIKDGITFQYKDPNQRGTYQVTIVTKKGGEIVMLRHAANKGIRTSIVSTLTYVD